MAIFNSYVELPEGQCIVSIYLGKLEQLAEESTGTDFIWMNTILSFALSGRR